MSDKKIIFPEVDLYTAESEEKKGGISTHVKYTIVTNFRKKNNDAFYLRHFIVEAVLPLDKSISNLFRRFYVDAYKNLLLMQVDEDWELDENQESETERLIKL